jgi:hypothetical protein
VTVSPYIWTTLTWCSSTADWVADNRSRANQICQNLGYLTVAERESLYTSKQVRKALEAGEFLRALGYPTEKEALGISIVTHGNITNVLYGPEDIKHFFAIYGAQVPALRGKTTAKHVKRARTMDLDSKVQITSHEMTADVMHVAGEKFLVSISKPLGLLLVKPLSSQAVEEVGSVLQQHINTLRSRGLMPRVIYVDPHKSLVALQGKYPGVEIDPAGAGDHLDEIDTKIRRLK